MKNFSYTVFIFFMVFSASTSLGSCGKSCNTDSFGTDIQNAINDLQAAINTYSMDPTEANCTKYKNSATNYLNVVESFSDCAADIGQAQFDAALQAAQRAVDEIKCG